ncbi:Protein-S-isoprenylcysteine O-methyltransferase Ste14 [Mariniphaga anaerophila]|uniref:Protein-S-isoprenylcysteine O-methyltransferase Ste14 n=1 Tax=Mariniphaga anaerophila TaxID=1484053 RepID=A0A1M5EHZ7_9BACT|nr:isoprenylcysteine carboxylmethyltransferase family protein [Mariniphaga anaerophila]SHF78869.1 Protein-S-isoprenylcysteine O-methyltransferase Ste14 [Mariniphaga anaerophila]
MDILSIFPFLSFLYLIASVASRVVLLRKKGVVISAQNKKEQLKLLLLYPVFALLFLIWLTELTKPLFQFSWSVLPEFLTKIQMKHNILNNIGVTLIITALVLWSFTLVHFRHSLRFGLSNNNQGQLITKGVFSFSRNPFFLSIDLYFAGLALFFPSIFFLVMALLTLVSIHFFILKEEKFLEKYYGKTYLDYKKKVRRYF